MLLKINMQVGHGKIPQSIKHYVLNNELHTGGGCTWEGWPSLSLSQHHHISIFQAVTPQGSGEVSQRLLCIGDLQERKQPLYI